MVFNIIINIKVKNLIINDKLLLITIKQNYFTMRIFYSIILFEKYFIQLLT